MSMKSNDHERNTMSTDNDTHLMRRAAETERRAERHWPADLLMQAADTIDLLRHELAAAKREGGIEARAEPADEMDDTDDPDAVYVANGDIDLWLRARAARLRVEQS